MTHADLANAILAAALPKPSHTTTLTLDLSTLPAVIADSIRAVLDAHDLAIVRHADTTSAWDGERLERLFGELGRNVAQAVVCDGEDA